jgi:hypothetical protein
LVLLLDFEYKDEEKKVIKNIFFTCFLILFDRDIATDRRILHSPNLLTNRDLQIVNPCNYHINAQVRI